MRLNLFNDPTDLRRHPAFNKSLAHFQRVRGPDLIARTEALLRWQDSRRSLDTWPYALSLEQQPGPEATARTERGELIKGVNFASQDYLSLSSHPAIAEAAVRAICEFGVHSAGSAGLAGNTTLSLALEQAIGELLGYNHVLLFPTGWGAGYGVITGLIRATDHILLDEMTAPGMQSGIGAATSNVVRFPHLDLDAVERSLREIRARDTRNAILVITEGLFSMESDVPDLRNLQALCREWRATLLVNTANDLGATGPNGSGSLGMQRMLGEIDLVIGAFSKSFASNGGFLATRSRAARQFVKMYGGPHTFSHALSPAQTAVALEAVRIVCSHEGDGLRACLMARIRELRQALEQRDIVCMGQPSPSVPVHIGNQKTARLASALLPGKGLLANLSEFTAAAVNSTRFRLEVMSAHTSEHIQTAARALSEAIEEAKETVAWWERRSREEEACLATDRAEETARVRSL